MANGGYNEWVSLGTRGSTGPNPWLCQTHSDKFGSRPSWGSEPNNTRVAKGVVRCCEYTDLKTGLEELSVGHFSYLNYGPNQDVFWWLQVPPANIAPGGQIMVSFTLFELEPQPQCRYDSVSIYSERLGEHTQLVSLCDGQGEIGPFYSDEEIAYYPDPEGDVQAVTEGSVFTTGTSMFLYLHSDEATGARGINVTYRLRVPKPVVTYSLPEIVMGTGQTTRYTFGADLFFNPAETAPLVFSVLDYLDFPLPDWLTFDAATRTFTGSPAPRNEGLEKFNIVGTNAYGYEAVARLVLHVVLLEEPDDSSLFSCEYDVLETPAQTSMLCQTQMRRLGVPINATSAMLQGVILAGLGGYVSPIETAEPGARFDTVHQFVFQPPMFGGTFELSDSLSSTTASVLVDAVPDASTSVVCSLPLAPAGSTMDCIITAKLYRAAAYTSPTLLFSGVLYPPVCTGPDGLPCEDGDVAVGPVVVLDGEATNHTQTFSFGLEFGSRFGQYSFSIGSQRDATVDVWTQPDVTTEAYCVPQVVQFRSVSCVIQVKRSGLSAFAPVSAFDVRVFPNTMGTLTLDVGQPEIASEFHYTFEAAETVGEADVRFYFTAPYSQFQVCVFPHLLL